MGWNFNPECCCCYPCATLHTDFPMPLFLSIQNGKYCTCADNEEIELEFIGWTGMRNFANPNDDPRLLSPVTEPNVVVWLGEKQICNGPWVFQLNHTCNADPFLRWQAYASVTEVYIFQPGGGDRPEPATCEDEVIDLRWANCSDILSQEDFQPTNGACGDEGDYELGQIACVSWEVTK